MDDFQYRCGPYYTTKFKEIQSLQDKVADFQHILFQNYKVTSVTESKPQDRKKRGIPMLKLIVSIATKIGKHWNKIYQISDILAKEDPWTLLRLNKLKSLKVAQVKDEMDDDDGCDVAV